MNVKLISFCTLILLTSTLACTGNHQEKEEVVQKVTKKLPPSFKLDGSLNNVTHLNSVIAVGGINVIETTSRQMKEGLVSFLANPLDLREQWLNNYVQTELLLDPKFVHPKRPLRFIEISHNDESHTVRILGINDLTGLKESLGNYLETKSIAGATVYVQKRYKDDKTPLLFTELGQGLIASTDEEELLKPEYLAYYKKIGTCRVEGIISTIFFPKNAAQSWGRLKDSQKAIDELDLKGSDQSIQRQKSLLKTLLTSAQQIATDSEKTTLTIRVGQPRVQVDLDWKIKNNSATKLLLEQFKGSDHELMKHAQTAALLLSLKLPNKTLSTLVKEWNRLALSTIVKSRPKVKELRPRKKKNKVAPLPPLLSSSEDQINEYLELVSQASKSLRGDVLLAALPYKLTPKTDKTHQDQEGLNPQIFLPQTNQQGLRWMGLFGHQNNVNLSRDIQLILDTYTDRVVAKNTRKRGIMVRIKQDIPFKIGDQEISSSHIKARMPRTPPILRPLRPQLKELYDAHLWIGEEFGLVGFADSWKQTFNSLITSFKQAKVKADSFIQQSYQAALEKPLVFFYLDPLTTIKSLKRGKAGSMLLPLQMMFTSVKASEGLSLSLATAKTGIQARLNIPHSLLSAIKDGMSGGLGEEDEPELESE